MSLTGDGATINTHVADHHVEPFAERVADDFSAMHILFVGKGNAVGQRPRVTLAGDGAKLVGGGQTLLMRRDDGGEKFSGKLVPEVVEEIFQRTAHAAVIIRRAENENIRRFHARFQSGIIRVVVGSVSVEEGQGFLGQIQHVHGAAISGEALGDMMDDGARDGFAMQTAGDGEDA